jgi:hypothetical protein
MKEEDSLNEGLLSNESSKENSLADDSQLNSSQQNIQ